MKYKIENKQYLYINSLISDKVNYFKTMMGELLNYKYLIKNIKVYQKNNHRIKIYKTVSDEEITNVLNEGNVYLKNDAALRYDKNTEKESGTNWQGTANYQTQNFQKISDKKLEEFLLLISYLKKEKVKVILFLPPFNPLYYNAIDLKTIKIFNEIKKILIENNLKYLGDYYNSSLYPEDFYDGYHLKREKLKIFF